MSETRPCDSCRICRCSLKVKFGSLTGKQFYSSSQNLFKPSQRKDSFGTVLADVCRRVRLVLLQDPGLYSDRVCNPCGIVKVATSPTVSGTSIKSTKRALATPDKASPSPPLPLPLLHFKPIVLSLGIIFCLAPTLCQFHYSRWRHIGLFIARPGLPGYSSLAQQNTPALQATSLQSFYFLLIMSANNNYLFGLF